MQGRFSRQGAQCSCHRTSTSPHAEVDPSPWRSGRSCMHPTNGRPVRPLTAQAANRFRVDARAGRAVKGMELLELPRSGWLSSFWIEVANASANRSSKPRKPGARWHGWWAAEPGHFACALPSGSPALTPANRNRVPKVEVGAGAEQWAKPSCGGELTVVGLSHS